MNKSLSWKEAHKLLKPANILLRMVLLFYPWQRLLGPEDPEKRKLGPEVWLYRYKFFRGAVYCIEPEPSMGFPGS